jgi:hypothetical protein
MTHLRLNGTDMKGLGNSSPELRDPSLYRQEYVEAFVDKWDELVDWDARTASEGGFFMQATRRWVFTRSLATAPAAPTQPRAFKRSFKTQPA